VIRDGIALELSAVLSSGKDVSRADCCIFGMSFGMTVARRRVRSNAEGT
jgi:hypothetical protein